MKIDTMKGFGQYSFPLCYELSNRTWKLNIKDMGEGVIKFISGKLLEINIGNVSQTNPYRAMKIDDEVYFLHFELENISPRTCLSIVCDEANGQVVILWATQGEVIENPKKVIREIYFASLRDESGVYPQITADYTDDLVGHAIDFTYSSEWTIRHTYLDRHSFRWAVVSDVERIRFKWQQEYCDYIKVNDHIYIFSWLEEVSGVQGLCVENLQRLYEVGGFFGIGPDGLPECYTTGAVGKEAVFHRQPEE